jgi:acetylornithine deacetylase/succinyl-diaminopimelate desuccinylase-like protein
MDGRPFQRCRFALAAALAACAVMPQPSRAQAQALDLERLQDEAVGLAQDYLRLRTVNPPGDEEQAAAFFAGIFEREGIPFTTASSAPGRGNVWARLAGGDEPALLLLHHMDVVPAEEEYWHADPFAGAIRDGYLWGRGALDTKTLGIVELEAFLALHRLGVPLRRDVVFMATADEEAGGFQGAGWVIDKHPEAFAGVGLLLNEGGGGIIAGGRKHFEIEVTQKVPLWLRLTATGKPGHGSRPPVASAVNRLVRALYRLQTYEFQPRIVPAVDRYFKAIADTADERWQEPFRNMAETVEDPEKLLELQLEYPSLHARTRNTCSITVLDGSSKINVVPPRAAAELDCRLLPDQDPEEFVELLRTIIDDPAIEIDKIMGFRPAVSPADTELYAAIVAVLRDHYPGINVVPAVQTGFTDSHFFRELGITCYGFDPFLVPEEDMAGVHGNDERISVDNVRQGTGIMLEIVRRLAVR